MTVTPEKIRLAKKNGMKNVLALAALSVDLADSSILETVDALKKRPDIYKGGLRLYMERAAAASKRAMAAARAGAADAIGKGALDFLDDRAEDMRRHVRIFEIQLKQYLDKRRENDTAIKSKVWLAEEMASFGVRQHRLILIDAILCGLKAKQELLPMSLNGVEKYTFKACALLLGKEWEEPFDAEKDKGIRDAVIVLDKRFNDMDKVLADMQRAINGHK